MYLTVASILPALELRITRSLTCPLVGRRAACSFDAFPKSPLYDIVILRKHAT